MWVAVAAADILVAVVAAQALGLTGLAAAAVAHRTLLESFLRIMREGRERVRGGPQTLPIPEEGLGSGEQRIPTLRATMDM